MTHVEVVVHVLVHVYRGFGHYFTCTELTILQLRGALHLPGTPGYDASRRDCWNQLMLDRNPAVIIEPNNVRDVVASIKYAAQHGLAVSARRSTSVSCDVP